MKRSHQRISHQWSQKHGVVHALALAEGVPGSPPDVAGRAGLEVDERHLRLLRLRPPGVAASERSAFRLQTDDVARRRAAGRRWAGPQGCWGQPLRARAYCWWPPSTQA